MLEDKSPKNQFALIEWYYLATPLFVLLDIAFGYSFRISALEENSMYQYAYYGICFLAGIICYRRRIYSAVFAIFESVLNIFLLIWSIMGPYYEVIHEAAQGNPIDNPLNFDHLINFGIVGVVLLISFYTNPLIGLASSGQSKRN